MNSLPILVGIVIGIALASVIFAVAFTLLCCVCLGALKILGPRNPFSAGRSPQAGDAPLSRPLPNPAASRIHLNPRVERNGDVRFSA